MVFQGFLYLSDEILREPFRNFGFRLSKVRSRLEEALETPLVVTQKLQKNLKKNYLQPLRANRG